ncbi:MAG: molybdate ABC transporter permease subunit [Verrucomicrobiota bacterium]|nr:molybdate ABC transporter permease subunit [Verrucomicrobiota bacterium]
MFLTAEEWRITAFTIAVCALAIAVMLPFGLGLAWLLAHKRWRGKTLVETFVTLPLIMPPVATGLLLLKICGRRGPVGAFLFDHFHIEIVFTWLGVLVAAAVMSFPLLVRAARVGFENVELQLEEIARTLGASDLRVFFNVTLPLASRAILAGIVLSFARAIGEFGATILLAGNIAGRTTTLSLKIYEAVQLGDDAIAYRLIIVCAVIAFLAVFLSERLVRLTAR